MVRTIQGRLFVTYLAVMLVFVLVVGLALGVMVNAWLMRATLAQLTKQGRDLVPQLSATVFAPEDSSQRDLVMRMVGSASQARVAVLDAGGEVLADSGGVIKLNRRVPLALVEAAIRRKQVMSQTLPLGNRDKLLVVIAPNADGTGALILYRQYKDLAATAQQVRRFIILGAILALIVTAIVSAIVARRLGGPLAAMARAANRLAKGEFGERIPAEGNDEVGQLARTFNGMSASLAQLVDDLRQSRAKFEAVLANIGDPLIAVSPGRQITFCNDAARRLFIDAALTPADAVGQDVTRVIAASVTEGLASAAETELSGRTYRLRTSPMGDGGTIALFADITDIRALERSRRELVSSISHDLRTPVTSIRGYVEALADGVAGTREEQAHYLDIIDRETQRLSRLIDDLFQLSKLDAGQITYSMTRLNLAALAAEAVERMLPQAEQAGIRLVSSGDAVPVPVRGDPDRLNQVVQNLLDNAIRYTPAGGEVRVTVSAASVARLTVSDTGSGIPEADLPHIFERFYRVDKARRSDDGGSGLGLAIARRLVEDHGGTVSVVSEVGRGSEFTVEIPLAGS